MRVLCSYGFTESTLRALADVLTGERRPIGPPSSPDRAAAVGGGEGHVGGGVTMTRVEEERPKTSGA
jgi:hypothetical protein